MQDDIKIIDVHELKKRKDLDPSLHLIDVRERNEWDNVRIPWATHIPKNEITQKIDTVSADRNTAIYLHCKSGMRSLMAAKDLIQLGYKEVYSVQGGIQDWIEASYAVEQGQQKTVWDSEI